MITERGREGKMKIEFYNKQLAEVGWAAYMYKVLRQKCGDWADDLLIRASILRGIGEKANTWITKIQFQKMIEERIECKTVKLIIWSVFYCHFGDVWEGEFLEMFPEMAQEYREFVEGGYQEKWETLKGKVRDKVHFLCQKGFEEYELRARIDCEFDRRGERKEWLRRYDTMSNVKTKEISFFCPWEDWAILYVHTPTLEIISMRGGIFTRSFATDLQNGEEIHLYGENARVRNQNEAQWHSQQARVITLQEPYTVQEVSKGLFVVEAANIEFS